MNPIAAEKHNHVFILYPIDTSIADKMLASLFFSEIGEQKNINSILLYCIPTIALCFLPSVILHKIVSGSYP